MTDASLAVALEAPADFSVFASGTVVGVLVSAAGVAAGVAAVFWVAVSCAAGDASTSGCTAPSKLPLFRAVAPVIKYKTAMPRIKRFCEAPRACELTSDISYV